MATKVEHRFLLDTFFFEKVLKGNPDLQYKLGYITSKASGNKKNQNLISNKSREIILKNNPKISDEVLKYFLNRIKDPEYVQSIEDIDDEVERNVKYAISLTYYFPNKVIIFTTKEKLDEYEKNKHYQNIKSVSLITDDDAIKVVEFWFKKCRYET